jgi:hypothetical protein
MINEAFLLIQDDSELSERPPLGEILVSLFHNPSEGTLTITIKSAEGLQGISKTGKISMLFVCILNIFVKKKWQMLCCCCCCCCCCCGDNDDGDDVYGGDDGGDYCGDDGGDDVYGGNDDDSGRNNNDGDDGGSC